MSGKLALLWCLPALMIALALPMVLGKIPPNRYYGFRTRKTLSNSEIWYRANRGAGIDLIIASLASLLASAMLVPLLGKEAAFPASLLLFVVASMLATGISFRRVGKL